MGRKVQVGKDMAGWFRVPGGCLKFLFENLDWWTNLSLFGVAEHLVLRLWACFL